VLTAVAAVKKHGQGTLVIFPAKLGDASPAAAAKDGGSPSGRIGQRFMANLWEFSLTLAKGEAQSLGP
jgi:hypothetical protein